MQRRFSCHRHIHNRVLIQTNVCVSVTPPPPPPHPSTCTPNRAKISQTKEENDQQRGQATTDGLHSRAAAKTKIGVSDKSISDRAEATEPGAGAGPERVPDQDLVSEQEGQNQEGHGR